MLLVFALLNLVQAQLTPACPLLACPLGFPFCGPGTKTVSTTPIDATTKCPLCPVVKCETCTCPVSEADLKAKCAANGGVWTSALLLKRNAEQTTIGAASECNCNFGVCTVSTKQPCALPPCMVPPTCADGQVLVSEPVFDPTTKCPMCPKTSCMAKPVCPAIACAAPSCAAGSAPVLVSEPVLDPNTKCPGCAKYECKPIQACPAIGCALPVCADGSAPVLVSEAVVDPTTKCPGCPKYECKPATVCPKPACQLLQCPTGKVVKTTSATPDDRGCVGCPIQECVSSICPVYDCAAPPPCSNGNKPTIVQTFDANKCPACPKYECSLPTCNCPTYDQQKAKCLSVAGNVWTPNGATGGGQSAPGSSSGKRDVEQIVSACLCAPLGTCTPPTGGCKCVDLVADCKANGGTWVVPVVDPTIKIDPTVKINPSLPIDPTIKIDPTVKIIPSFQIDPTAGPSLPPQLKRQTSDPTTPFPGLPNVCLCAAPLGFCKRPVTCTIACPAFETADSCLKQPNKIWVPKDFYPVPLPQPLPLPAEKVKRQAEPAFCGCPQPNGICIDKPVSPCLCAQKPTVCPDGQFFTAVRAGGDVCDCNIGKCNTIVPPVYCTTSKCLYGSRELCLKAGGVFAEANASTDAKFVAACGCPVCKFNIKIDVTLPPTIKPSDLPELLQQKLGKAATVVGINGGKVQIEVSSDAAATGDASSATDVLQSLTASGVVTDAQLSKAEPVVVTDPNNGAAGLRLLAAALVVAAVALL